MDNAPEIWFPNLGIEIQKLSRVAVTIFGFEIYWYGVFIVLGVLAGLATGLHEAKRTGQNRDDYLDFLFVGLLFALIGARLYYVVFSWVDYKDNPIKVITGIRSGGLAIYGGIIAAIITAFVFTHIRKMKFFLLADTGAPSLVLGQAIGRWGNFFNREAYGGVTYNRFAMRILTGQAEGLTPAVLAQKITARGAEYIQVHPTFLYESMWNFTLFILLTLYRPHKRFDGEVFLLYLAGYGLGRFFIESLRTDQLFLFNTGLPVSQVLSAMLFFAAIIALPVLRGLTNGKYNLNNS